MAAVGFRIAGRLRYLSHAETVRVLERASVRADIPVEYSHGFNPRPRVSLPLPRSVGVESDDELLCLLLKKGKSEHSSDAGRPKGSERLRDGLSRQVPEGIEILDVAWPSAGVSIQPAEVSYVFRLSPNRSAEIGTVVEEKIKKVLQSSELIIERRRGGKRKPRTVDLRRFIADINMQADRIMVWCGVSNAGTIRVDEIMRLLGLEQRDLAAPVKRSEVEWKYE